MSNVVPYREKLSLIVEAENRIEDICAHIANGGDLITLCRDYGVRYSDVINWINVDKERSRQYGLALVARDEWMAQRLLVELRAIGESDIRQAFNPDGTLRAPGEWPEGLARAIASVDSEELIDSEGEYRGTAKKIKLWPKMEALKLQMQKLGMLVERKQLNVQFDVSERMQELEDARRRAREASAPPAETPVLDVVAPPVTGEP